MAVFRVERTRDYTVMSNHHLKNRSLSLKAKGLLSVMLSLPDEWDYTLRGLAAISREGVDAIREAIRELEDAGYIVRSRGRNEKGQLSGTEYVIYEHPQQSADAPVLDIPTQEKSVVVDKSKEELKTTKPLDFNTSKTISEPYEASGGSGKTPMWENPTLENPTLEKPTLENPTLENPTQLNTKRSKTNSESKKQTTSSLPLSIPSPSLPAQTEGGMDEDQVRKYRNQVKRNIDYFEISEDYAANLEQLDEIVDPIVFAVSLRGDGITGVCPTSHSSRLFGFSRKSIMLMMTIPFSLRHSFTRSLTTMIFLKESPIRTREFCSCSIFSRSGIAKADWI